MSEIVVLTKSELTEIISNAVADGIRIYISGETKSEMQAASRVKYPLFSDISLNIDVRTYNSVVYYMTGVRYNGNEPIDFTVKDVANKLRKKAFLRHMGVGEITIKRLEAVLNHYGLELK